MLLFELLFALTVTCPSLFDESALFYLFLILLYLCIIAMRLLLAGLKENSQMSEVDVCYSYRNSSYLDSYLDPAFMSLIKDPDQRRKEQWEKTAQAQSGWNCAKMLGFGDLGGPPLSAAEEYSLHSRYLAKANSLNLSEIAEMKIV